MATTVRYTAHDQKTGLNGQELKEFVAAVDDAPGWTPETRIRIRAGFRSQILWIEAAKK